MKTSHFGRLIILLKNHQTIKYVILSQNTYLIVIQRRDALLHSI
ncbi:hypothetical protein EDF66_101490 [Sphingobacterium sp. JUb20]|nr:hypothetical protein [Sphingobacterium sp. JUb21]TCR10675.1 hypothetical protein EDF66_101490 [Sphingobacterium sp. JUb20]